MARTLYQILGVPPNATDETIHAGYVRAAGKLREGRGGNADERNAVRQAYEILSDPASRARYDRSQYTVADAAESQSPGLSVLFTPRGVVILLVVIGTAVAGAAVYTREKRLARIEQERIEALRQQQEEQRRTEAERIENERRQQLEQRQDAAAERELSRAARVHGADSARREAAERNAEIRAQQLELARQRAEERREQTERARQEREARIQLERDKRLLQEMERSRPRQF